MVLRRGRSSRAVHLRPASWEAVQESVRGGRAEDSESPRFYEDRGARLAAARASFAVSPLQPEVRPLWCRPSDGILV